MNAENLDYFSISLMANVDEEKKMQLPDVELVAAKLHEDWRQKKLESGITSRISAESGEELMVPYEKLSENAKELNRQPVRVVYNAIRSL